MVLLTLSSLAIIVPAATAAPTLVPTVTIQISPSTMHAENMTETRSDWLEVWTTVFVDQPPVMRTTTTVTFDIPDGWIVSPSQATHTTNGASGWSSLWHIGVPAGACAAVTHEITATASCEVAVGVVSQAEDTATVTVPSYCQGSMRLYPSQVKAGPGETVLVEGVAMNDGNDNATFELGLESAPYGFSVTVSPTKLYLTFCESKKFTATVQISPSVMIQQHTIILEMHNVPEKGEPLVKTTCDLVVDTNPLQAVLTASPKKAAPGMEVTFDGGSSIVGSGEARYKFEFGDGTSSEWVVTPQIKHAYAEEGDYTARLTVQGEGGTRSTNDASVNIKVTTEGFKPTAVIAEISPDPVHMGDEVTLIGRGEPVGTTAIKAYQWRSSLDGELGTTALLHVSSMSVGLHNITFRVQDQRGTWSEPVARDLRVLPPRDMWQVTVSRPKEGAVVSGSTTTVEGTAAFGAVPIEKVEVRLDGGDWVAVGGRAEWTFTLDLTGVADGRHTLEVRAHAAGSVSDTIFVTFRTGEEPGTPLVPNVSNSQLTVGVLVLVTLVVLLVASRRRARVAAL